ncbi:major facilitator superfamily domain-containing protein [Pelagophyceae sp. CCMP2097]|nr:major facilitator superfamily domain-containing protein [Pelagophyceae sp. CCMP2097]
MASHLLRRAPSEAWVPLFKVQVFFSCVAFSIVVPSLAPYLDRLGAPQWVLGVAVAIYSVGEMVGSIVFGRAMVNAMRTDPADGPRKCLVMTIVFGVVGSALYVLADVAAKCNGGGTVAATLVVLGRFLSGIWTGGKMVVEQSYIGEACLPQRVTELTSEVGVFAVLGFVARPGVGPSIGAIFAGLDAPLLPGVLGSIFRLDGYTAPGYFMLIACTAMLGASATYFRPADGYARPVAARARLRVGGAKTPPSLAQNSEARPLHGEKAPIYGGLGQSPPPVPGGRRSSSLAAPKPNSVGLAACLVCFGVHFYSFAIQETITTPYVAAAFGWSQRNIDGLFAGVSLLSLLTRAAVSVLLSKLAKCCDDVLLLAFSLLLGFAGSALLLDAPLAAPLTPQRFLLGFSLITVAFPFGRTVSLAIFSKVLGDTPQGNWMGLMFVVGAVPRCLGPSWALYALRLACDFVRTCPPGGATYLEFGISGSLFLAAFAGVVRVRKSLRPAAAAQSDDATPRHAAEHDSDDSK